MLSTPSPVSSFERIRPSVMAARTSTWSGQATISNWSLVSMASPLGPSSPQEGIQVAVTLRVDVQCPVLVLEIRVEETATVVDGVPFRLAVQFEAPGQLWRLGRGDVEDDDQLIAGRGHPDLLRARNECQ